MMASALGSDRPPSACPGLRYSLRTCGARKYDPCRDLRFFEMSGGARVFVDKAAQDGFSEDPSAVEVGNYAVEVGNYEVATVVFTVGDSLGDPLVRPGPVVVHLVFTQDGAQMAFPEDQHAVQELTAQGTDEALSR